MKFQISNSFRACSLSLLALSAEPVMAQNTTNPLFPLPPAQVSTVPSNGDVNPYGVVFVPNLFLPGTNLNTGDILVSNFNNSANLQGTGTTITRITPRGETSTFFQGRPGLGLTAALGIVRRGFVFVGNLPTADGTAATISNTSLLILNGKGQIVGSLSDRNLIAGPWGMAVHDQGATAQIFLSNVLNGTVSRLDLAFEPNGNLKILAFVRIASGYAHRTDPAALVLGPSGVAYDGKTDTLYVASSDENAVYAIEEARQITSDRGRGRIIYQDAVHLHGPLDLVLAPSGHLITANSDGSNVDPNQPSELVEFTTAGKFVAQYSVDPNNGGAFGVGLQNLGTALRFAAVDDNANTLRMWTVAVQ